MKELLDTYRTYRSSSATIPADAFDYSLFRYLLLKIQIYMSRRKYRERIFRLGSKAIIKIGFPLSEAQAMDFVTKNTNIPVPRILSVFTAKGEVHIVMEYIRAPTVA